MPSLEITITLSIGSIIRDSSKAEVKETFQTDTTGVKNVYKGHNNISERYKIFKLFNFIQIIFM